MWFVTKSNRILSDDRFLNNEEYIVVDDYPIAPTIDGKYGYVCGIDMENNKVLFAYEDIPIEPTPEPTTEQTILKMAATVDYLAMMAE